MEKDSQTSPPGIRGTKSIGGREYWRAGKSAAYLGVAKNTLLKYASSGKITCLRLGCLAFFTKEWLDDFLCECTKLGFADRGA